MADASRFPHLAIPFAIVGAAGGWLSAGLVQHPIIHYPDSKSRVVTAGATAVLGLLTGALIRRWCAGARYHWEVYAPDPDKRLPSDSWARHAPAILAAGALAGAVFASVADFWVVPGILGGMLCTVPFLPVCGAVLAAARRAQRARLGSLVAGSDRRAVWAILATTLLLVSLEALPDWPAPIDGELDGRLPALGLLGGAIGCILGVLVADVLAYRRANRVLAQGLAQHAADDPALAQADVPRTDLGLGDDILAQVSRTSAVYRGRDRALALVQGSPEQARSALRRSLRRSCFGLAVAGAVAAAHTAAASHPAWIGYEQVRCESGRGESCNAVAYDDLLGSALGRPDPQRAILMFERGCNQSDAVSCMSLARLYRGNDGIVRDPALVAYFEYRAAQRGLCPDGTRLVRGSENVCVDPLDPRR